MAERRLVFAHDVKGLLNGLESLPWEEEVDYLVDALPAPDAVEVVRCGNCKHYVWEQEPCHGRVQRFCKLPKGLTSVWAGSFCSYGERRDSDG